MRVLRLITSLFILFFYFDNWLYCGCAQFRKSTIIIELVDTTFSTISFIYIYITFNIGIYFSLD